MSTNKPEGWEDVIRYDVNLRQSAKKKAELTEQHLSRIRGSRLTKRILYPLQSTPMATSNLTEISKNVITDEQIAIKNAYDYVHTLYPEAGIKNIVALHTSKALLEDCGYYGVGGFYDCNSRVVVISNNVSATENNEFDMKTEFTVDEVLCHEMIHYGANFNKPLSNRQVEEEIAYGKSAGYLRGKGRSDKFIIERNMMPYLISIVDRVSVLNRIIAREWTSNSDITTCDISSMSQKQQDALVESLRPKLAAEMIIMATELGQQIIDLYCASEQKTNPEVIGQFAGKRKLILDDDI